MKTVRRLTVEIERRTLVLIQRGVEIGGAGTPSESSVAEKPKGDCPDCGSPWVLVQDAGAAPREGQSIDLQSFRDVHLHASPSGHLWICQQLLQRFITRKSEEHL